jgi:protein-tyrosine phosphatase
MIDIHCHIIPGVDDGASDLEEALEMARIAYADGIRHIIATPHFANTYLTDRNKVLHGVETLRSALEKAALPVQIYPGNEVRLESAEFVRQHAKERNFCFLGPAERFILLEQSWKRYNEDTPEVLRWLLEQGIQPIIPHPERHLFFRRQPELLLQLIKMGAWTQVSVDSLLGKNGEDAKSFGEWLIDEKKAHTLATDAHNPRRKPNLSLGYEIVRRLAGEAEAEAMHERAARIIAAE